MENLMNEDDTTSLSNGGISFLKGVSIALWLLVAQLVVALPFLLYQFWRDGAAGADNMSGTSLGLILVIAFPLAAWIVLRKRSLASNTLALPKPFVLLFITAFLLMFAISFLVGDLLTYLPGYEGMLENYGSMFGEINPIFLFLGGVLIGPICEEIIFRGVILQGFMKRYKPWQAIVFSAAIFGIIHGLAIQVIYAFILGLVLGWIFYRTRSLMLCIVLHIANNAVAFLGENAESESMREIVGSDFYYFGSLGIAVLVAILSGFIFVRNTPASVSQDLFG